MSAPDSSVRLTHIPLAPCYQTGGLPGAPEYRAPVGGVYGPQVRETDYPDFSSALLSISQAIDARGDQEEQTSFAVASVDLSTMFLTRAAHARRTLIDTSGNVVRVQTPHGERTGTVLSSNGQAVAVLFTPDENEGVQDPEVWVVDAVTLSPTVEQLRDVLGMTWASVGVTRLVDTVGLHRRVPAPAVLAAPPVEFNLGDETIRLPPQLSSTSWAAKPESGGSVYPDAVQAIHRCSADLGVSGRAVAAATMPGEALRREPLREVFERMVLAADSTPLVAGRALWTSEVLGWRNAEETQEPPRRAVPCEVVTASLIAALVRLSRTGHVELRPAKDLHGSQEAVEVAAKRRAAGPVPPEALGALSELSSLLGRSGAGVQVHVMSAPLRATEHEVKSGYTAFIPARGSSLLLRSIGAPSVFPLVALGEVHWSERDVWVSDLRLPPPALHEQHLPADTRIVRTESSNAYALAEWGPCTQVQTPLRILADDGYEALFVVLDPKTGSPMFSGGRPMLFTRSLSSIRADPSFRSDVPNRYPEGFVERARASARLRAALGPPGVHPTLAAQRENRPDDG